MRSKHTPSCAASWSSPFSAAPWRLWFTFRSLEEVLAAARLGNPAPEGDLVWCDGVYWLSLPADAERAACLLSEFPVPPTPPPSCPAAWESTAARSSPAKRLPSCYIIFPRKWNKTGKIGQISSGNISSRECCNIRVKFLLILHTRDVIIPLHWSGLPSRRPQNEKIGRISDGPAVDTWTRRQAGPAE